MNATVLKHPASPRRQNRSYLLLGAILLVIGAAFWMAANWPQHAASTVLLPVHDVKIEGEVRYTDRGGLRQLITAHLADGLLRVDIERLREELLSLPWIESASVRRMMPDTLLVHLVEHEPVARWNQTQLLGRDGSVFEHGQALAASVHATLPELHGPQGLQREVHAAHRRYAPVLRQLGMQLASVSFDGRRSVRLTTTTGVEIVLGREHVEHRLHRFVTVYRRSLVNEWVSISRVDLRYTNGLAVYWTPVQG